jgi:hypothetical protein
MRLIFAISCTGKQSEGNNTQMDLSVQNGARLPELDLEYTDR